MGVAVVFEAVLEAVEGERLAIVTVNLAYPLADTILLGLVVGALAASGWRVSRTWALLAGGVALFAVFHFVYSTRWRSAPTRSARQSIWGRSPPRS